MAEATVTLRPHLLPEERECLIALAHRMARIAPPEYRDGLRTLADGLTSRQRFTLDAPFANWCGEMLNHRRLTLRSEMERRAVGTLAGYIRHNLCFRAGYLPRSIVL